MSFGLAIDPGLRVLGASIWSGKRLVKAELLKNPEKKASGPKAWGAFATLLDRWYWENSGHRFLDWICVEKMKVYTIGKGKGNPASLLELASLSGMLFGLFPDAMPFHPTAFEWKGNLDKEETEKRINERLDASDGKVVLAGALSHNVWDSVGIGLKQVGRFERNRVIHR